MVSLMYNHYNNINNTENHYHIENNPNGYKTDEQIEYEIEVLKEKISNNRASLTAITSEDRILIENQITEDELRVSQLEMTLNERRRNREKNKKSSLIAWIFVIIMIVIDILIYYFIW